VADFNVKTFLAQRIAAVDPAIDTADTSQWSQIIGGPMTVFLTALEQLIQVDDAVRDVRLISALSFDQVAALAANFFVEPKLGENSTGTVTIFFTSPQDAVIVLGQAFTANNGSRFAATIPVSITSAQLASQYDTVFGGYRLDVPGVTSSGVGPEFSVKAGNITSFDGQPSNVLLVTNLTDFSVSVASETKEQLAARVIASASMRNFCSADSTTALLLGDARLLAVSVIGAGDREMIRDILYGGLHINAMQDTYVYGAAPLTVTVLDQPILPDSLPSFVFYGHNIYSGILDPNTPIGTNAGPVVAVQKMEYGTGTGSGFVAAGTLALDEDFRYEFMPGGIAATKNSPEEFWRIKFIKRPPEPSTTVRATVLRNMLPSILQEELKNTPARTPSHFTLFKAFTVATVDVIAVVKPLPGASVDPQVYTNAIRALIIATPIAGTIDESDIIDVLVRAGADRVTVPLAASANIFYPDLATATQILTGSVGPAALDRGPFTVRTIGFYPGNITVTVVV
jgi:hypothetical protein